VRVRSSEPRKNPDMEEFKDLLRLVLGFGAVAVCVWLWLRIPRPPQMVTVQTVHFIGEQDGPPERELKEKLIVLFGQLKLVKIAYLARVKYRETGLAGVALCVRGQPGQERMFAKRVGKVFSPMFASPEHLDVIWLTPDQETSLAKVCTPFYTVT